MIMDTNTVSIELCRRMEACLNELAEAKGVARCGLVYAMAQLIDALKKQLQVDEKTQEDQSCMTEHIQSPSATEP
jgi:hypothetical protein